MDNYQDRYPLALAKDTILNGRYIITEVLGQGGFGITYKAQDWKSKRYVAIKEFMPEGMAMRADGITVSAYSGQRADYFNYGKECFLSEAKTLSEFIGNPNVVKVESYFEENGTAYFVMEYVEGKSFKEYIKECGGKVSVDDANRILFPVIDALSAAHQKGIIHRDVTPDNIYITENGMVKLLDFGAARYSLGDRSRSLDVILKSGYAPKEQYIRRGRQGPFTDVYSLAACYYASITGYIPPESIERIERDNLIPLSRRGVDIPAYMEDAILKGLELNPADRFQSMTEFKRALDGIKDIKRNAGREEMAAAEQIHKRKKRKPLIIGISAAAVTAFVLLIGVIYYNFTSTAPVSDIKDVYGSESEKQIGDVNLKAAGENENQSDNNLTLEEYINVIQEDIDRLKTEMEESGLRLDVKVNGNSLVYSYQFTTDVDDTEQLKISLEQVMDEQASSFEALASQLMDKVSDAESIILEYLEPDGNLLCSREFR